MQSLDSFKYQLTLSSISLAGAATSIKNVFVATKHVFCRDKNIHIFVATDICIFVAIKLLSRQTRVCYDKTFVATKIFYKIFYKKINLFFCVKVEVAVLGSPSLISLRFLWT